MKDYYATLGLDPNASLESIKLAYRRLAREFHPDRNLTWNAAEWTEANARMVELNEAYSVLRNGRRRREYDGQSGRSAAEPLASAEATPASPATQTRPRVRPSAEVVSNVVREFSEQLRRGVLSNRQAFRWRERRLEGFEWALQASFWSASYCVALRGFTTADSAAARKFTNYALLAVARSRRLFKKNFLLLLLPFHQISEPEAVWAICRRFTETAGGKLWTGQENPIVLLDLHHSRSLFCGPRVTDQRLLELLRSLGFSHP